jgi:hypothetical protein
LKLGVERLAFEVWLRAAASQFLDARPDPHRACGGPNAKRQTPNEKHDNPRHRKLERLRYEAAHGFFH